MIDASPPRSTRYGPPGVDRRTSVDLPRGKDRVGDARVGQEPERVEVDRGLGQPHAGRSPPEPELEVAQPPADLGASIGGTRQREDGVVERLGHPVHAAVTVDEAVVGDAVAVLQPVRERGPESHEIAPEVAELGVRPVALRADALIPVVGGRRGRIARHRAGERVEPGGW